MYKLVNYLIAIIWIINGLFCKVLNLVPRHELIVSTILGNDYSHLLTKAIGVGEISIAIWIMSLREHRLCAIVQIVLIVVMNIVEFFVAPDFLLFGKLNAVFALILIAVIYYNEFINGKLKSSNTYS